MITELDLGADNSVAFFIHIMTQKLMMNCFNDLFGEELYKVEPQSEEQIHTDTTVRRYHTKYSNIILYKIAY